jgi:hypothetical protein
LGGLLNFARAFPVVIGRVYPLDRTFSGMLNEEQLTTARNDFKAVLHCYLPA